ncbi:MAG: hypothetical protein LBI06_02030 [Treponema sp.]|jgi:hypothetical protein|nr:hypothetical protein [Treponema sp.]
MGDIIIDKEGQSKLDRRWLLAVFFKKGVRAALAISLAIFVVYLVGSLPDPGFPDWALFLLLRLLQYSSLMLCAFSLFSMGFCVHRLVYHPGIHNALSVAFYFTTAILGAGFAMLNSMIIAVSRGHG